MRGQGSGQGQFHSNHWILSTPASFPEGDGLIELKFDYVLFFFKNHVMLYYTAEKRIHITEKNKQTNKQKKNKKYRPV